MQLIRLLSAQPQTDGEKFVIKAAWHNDDWYLDAYGQNPAPFYHNPFLDPPNRPPYPWRPGVTNIWGANDATFPTKYGFRTAISLANSPATIDFYGSTPANAAPSGDSPQVPLQATTANTGGSIHPGSYLIAISASPKGPVSHFVACVVPAGTNTNTITVSNVEWNFSAPAAAVYAGENSLTMRDITSGHWSGSSADIYGNSTVYLITAIPDDGYGLPDIVFKSFVFQAKVIVHGGLWGLAATSIGSSGGHATAFFAGMAWTVNQWAGYTLTAYQWDNGITGPMNFLVLSNTADTLTFASTFAPPAGIAACVMRAKAAHITASTIGDDNFVSFNAPSGLTVNAEAGNLIRIIAGTGKGQPPIPIASNTATVLTIVGEWYTTPDSTSIYIIESPIWKYRQGTNAASSEDASYGYIGSLSLLNFRRDSIMVMVLTADSDGKTSPEAYAPIREIFVQALNFADAYYTITIVSATATIDLSNGLLQRIVLSATPVTVLAPVSTGGTLTDSAEFTLLVDQDATGGRAIPTFTTGAGGFSSDVAAWQIEGTLSSRTTYIFVLTGGVWGLKAAPPVTGGPVT